MYCTPIVWSPSVVDASTPAPRARAAHVMRGCTSCACNAMLCPPGTRRRARAVSLARASFVEAVSVRIVWDRTHLRLARRVMTAVTEYAAFTSGGYSHIPADRRAHHPLRDRSLTPRTRQALTLAPLGRRAAGLSPRSLRCPHIKGVVVVSAAEAVDEGRTPNHSYQVVGLRAAHALPKERIVPLGGRRRDHVELSVV